MAGSNINRVIITGNLTRDPEMGRSRAAAPVCSLRIACNGRRKNNDTGKWEEEPNYFDVTVWGAQGENCGKYLRRAAAIAIDGRLRWREWSTQDGQKRQGVDIIADTVQFLGGGVTTPATGTGSRAPRARPRATFRSTPAISRPRPWRQERQTTIFRSRSVGADRVAKATQTAGSPARQEGRPDFRAAQAVPVLPRQDRPRRLQGPVDAAAVRVRARQDPLADGSPAPAAGIRARSRAPSSARASWRCCRTSPRAATIIASVDRRGDRDRDR